MTPRLYIFDADDTLRRTLVPGQPCPHGPWEWELLPGVHRRLTRIPFGPQGPFLAITSNQDHVGYGLISAALARRLLRDLAVAAAGPVQPAPYIAFCPRRLEEACLCRKPAPGLLLEALARFGVMRGDTLFVGNAPWDAEAAARARISFVYAQEFFCCVGD